VKKPGIPLTVVGLCIVAALGLVTQYLAAEHAFSLIGRTALYSYAAALLIESAIVVDAVVFSKNRNLIAGISLLVALVVSGVYNYTLADLSHADIALGQKLALAIGPLIALTTIALALGEELYKWDLQRAEYAAEQASQKASQSAELEKIARLAQEARDRAAAETARAQRAARDEQVAWERELEERERAAKLHSDELARRRAERWERKSTVPPDIPPDIPPSSNGSRSPLDELVKLSPHALENRRAFRSALVEHPEHREGITPKALAERTGQTERTARRWVSDAKEK